MAVRQKGSRWEVYYRDPVTGKQRTRLVKTRQEAIKEDKRVKYLLEFDRQKLIDEDAARVAVPAARLAKTDEMQQKADELTKYKISSILEKTIEWHCLSETSNYTQKQKICDLKSIAKLIGFDTDVRSIDTAFLAALYQKKAASGVKPQTVYRSFSDCKVMLKVAVNLGLLANLPKFPTLPKREAARNIPLSEEELQSIYKVANAVLKRIIILGARFGMRVGQSEMLSLKWSDFDFDKWLIRLRAARKNKNVQIRVLPVPEAYRPLFTEWHEQDKKHGYEYVCTSRGGKRMSRVDIRTWLRLLKRAGIERIVRPYDLRHSFATNMIRAGVAVTTVARLMGHANLTMLFRHYQFIDEEDKLNALSALAGEL